MSESPHANMDKDSTENGKIRNESRTNFVLLAIWIEEAYLFNSNLK